MAKKIDEITVIFAVDWEGVCLFLDVIDSFKDMQYTSLGSSSSLLYDKGFTNVPNDFDLGIYKAKADVLYTYEPSDEQYPGYENFEFRLHEEIERFDLNKTRIPNKIKKIS